MNFKKILYAYYPGKKFPAISITGRTCQLNCAHCGGHYLESMIAAEDGDSLYRTCLALWSEGAMGVLISGGCDQRGRIDLGPFYLSMKRIKEDTGLVLNLHTGLLKADEIERLSEVGVDAVSFDLTGDNSVIRNVYGLELTVDDYEKCIKALVEEGMMVIPHVCIGLNPGNLDGEKRAIEILKPFGIQRLIFIIFIPTRGTRMAEVPSPKAESVGEVISHAGKVLPDTELVLGCMRPRRPERYELTAVEAGANGIVLPSNNTLEKLKADGWEIINSEQCCAVPR